MWDPLGLPPAIPVFLTLLPIAKPTLAAVDFQKCCTIAPVSEELKPLQWDACHSSYNSSETDPTKKWAPEIVTTYAWCHKVCEASGDFQASDTNQWLSPFTAWIIPACALVLLPPPPERLESNKQYPPRTKRQKLWRKSFSDWWFPVVEYTQILGDPASAFNGALAQMIADRRLFSSMHRKLNRTREQDLIRIVILVKQADFSSPQMRNAMELMARSSQAREYTRTAGRVIWSARKKFNTSVVLPISLYIGVAAAVFYEAYQKLGDNSTSHSLGYCVWYNWVLLLSVFADCFASHSNLDAVRSGMEIILRRVLENHTPTQLSQIDSDGQAAQTLEQYRETAAKSLSPYPALHPPMLLNPWDLFSGCLDCQEIPLRKRYQNTRNWVRWLHKNGVEISSPTEGICNHRIPWLDWYSRHHPEATYLITQLLCWLFVLFCCSCAAVLSCTTPKVVLGCRSLNHIIYASIALLNAVTHVAKDALERPNPENPDSEKPKHALTHKFVRGIYHLMCWANAIIVLIGGSLLQITGVFRNCWCKSGLVGWNANSTIILSSNTYTHQYWARAVWLKVAYAAYGEFAFFCVAALYIRYHVANSIRKSLISDGIWSLE